MKKSTDDKNCSNNESKNNVENVSEEGRDTETEKSNIQTFKEIDLDKLKSSELKTYSYEKITNVVKNLEQVFLKDLPSVGVREKFDSYYGHATDIKNMALMGKFDKKLSTSTKKESFISKIENIMFNFSVLMNISNFSAEQVQNFKNTEKNLLKNIEDEKTKIESDLNKMQQDISKAVEKQEQKTKDEISKVEHTTLSHVLSIMGIFTAVIVVIMSLILTATSWLNNADGASVIIAFVVPNLIALIAVLVLLSVIHLFFEKQKEKSKMQLFKPYIPVALVTVLLLSVVIIFGVSKKESQIPHQQYVISTSDYNIIEIDESEEERSEYFEIFFDGQRYTFKYDERYVHEKGRLYFCKEHNTLE